jgi:Domain of unknown function (DUF4336)
MSELRVFGNDLWIIEGPEVRDFGITFPTRMSVARLSNGSLWVSSPVLVPFETLEHLTRLGPVRYLVAATPRHVWRLHTWHTLFPRAQLWSSRQAPLSSGQRHLPLTGVLGDAPHPDWADDFDQLAFKGNPLAEEIFFFHRPSRTLIVDDFIQHCPIVPGKPLRNLLSRLEGVAEAPGGVGLEIKLTFIDRKRARRSLAKLLSWDFDKLIIAHGDCMDAHARPFVEQAFSWLMR